MSAAAVTQNDASDPSGIASRAKRRTIQTISASAATPMGNTTADTAPDGIALSGA